MAAKELVVKIVILIAGAIIGFALGVGTSLWLGLPASLMLVVASLAALAAMAALWIGIEASYGPPRSFRDPVVALILLSLSIIIIFLILMLAH